MSIATHPAPTLKKLSIGREGAPLLVIDNTIPDAESLVELAATKAFTEVVDFYYPGIRAKVPLTYRQYILEKLGPSIAEYFGRAGDRLHFTDMPFFARDDTA